MILEGGGGPSIQRRDGGVAGRGAKYIGGRRQISSSLGGHRFVEFASSWVDRSGCTWLEDFSNGLKSVNSALDHGLLRLWRCHWVTKPSRRFAADWRLLRIYAAGFLMGWRWRIRR
jgi:hypothetical protein